MLRRLKDLKDASTTADLTVLVEKDSKDQVLRRLKDLKDAQTTADVTELVEEVLEAAYDSGVANLPFNEKIIALISETADKIESVVFKIGLQFDVDRAPYNLLLRSGLQFILDYKDKNGYMKGEALQLLGKKDGIHTLDEGISNWKGCNGFTEEDVVHSDEDLCRPEGVPKSHWWWFDDIVKQEDRAADGSTDGTRACDKTLSTC